MHTASDSTRRSRYTTLWFRTCAIILLYAHRARGDLYGANATPSVFMGINTLTACVAFAYQRVGGDDSEGDGVIDAEAQTAGHRAMSAARGVAAHGNQPAAPAHHYSPVLVRLKPKCTN